MERTDTIFVFASNLAGRHGAGSALEARRFYGAQLGVGEGRTGNAYAIPTKDANLKSLPLKEIERAVDDFKKYAAVYPNLRFRVVKIGCGLAGYEEKQIAPMFLNCPANVFLPDGWGR